MSSVSNSSVSPQLFEASETVLDCTNQPVIQAFYGSHKIPEKMHYLKRKLSENLETLRLNGGNLPVYDNTTCGSNLLNAWSKGRFGKSDIALQLYIDSTQLH